MRFQEMNAQQREYVPIQITFTQLPLELSHFYRLVLGPSKKKKNFVSAFGVCSFKNCHFTAFFFF